MPVKPTIGISFSSVNVEPPRLDHETIDRINRMWDNMTGEQKMPYQDKALPKVKIVITRFWRLYIISEKTN